ncbi:MAG: AmmeMemoRadiSam system protein B [Pirellulales bacterium]
MESFPVSQPNGETVFALRDPEGFAGAVVLPYQAALLASLMDGSRTLAELQLVLQDRIKQPVALADVEGVVRALDERNFLDTEQFRRLWKLEIERYLNLRVRPAAHVGGAYAEDPAALRQQLAALFTDPKGPGEVTVLDTTVVDRTNGNASAISGTLRGIISPHIDLRRGGLSFAWAYKKLAEESDADLFIILGTGHNPMRNRFALTKKDFDTPLGAVETDRTFVARLAARMAATPGGQDISLYGDELAHRQEHSIEFQALFLQYLLGDRRPFKIVPILTGSFHEFVAAKTSPGSSPEVAGFVSALRGAVAEYKGRVCFIASADLAHIGRRYGDQALLDAARLQQQSETDRRLMAAACAPDADAFFQQIAERDDRDRVCGLSPIYTMLAATQPQRGELLRYDQAVELDGTSCVSFASAAFYDG